MLNKITPVTVGIVTAVIVAAILVLTLIFTPDSNPAYDTAVEFMNAAGQGDDGTAMILLSDGLRAYAIENCPDGLPSNCIDDYTPDDWGALQSAVFRRAIPDGDNAWDIQLVATYERGQGFAGVCIYHRVERNTADQWRITAWSGFISCDDTDSGLQSLRLPGAANYVPPATDDPSAEAPAGAAPEPEATPEITAEPEVTEIPGDG